MSQTNAVEKIKTHTLCRTTFSENRAFYENVENVVETHRPQMAP
jgi:hypothetical protein